MAWKANQKTGQGAGKRRIEKVLLETNVGQGLMVFWGMYAGTIVGTAMLSPPGLQVHQNLGAQASLEASLLFACRWGKLCSARVQSGNPTGRLPSTAVLLFAPKLVWSQTNPLTSAWV